MQLTTILWDEMRCRDSTGVATSFTRMLFHVLNGKSKFQKWVRIQKIAELPSNRLYVVLCLFFAVINHVWPKNNPEEYLSCFVLFYIYRSFDKIFLFLVFMVPPSSLWPFQRESHPLPSYYFLKIVSDIFSLNKKRAGELQKPFPTRSRIASEAPLSFSTSSHPALNRFLWKLYSAFQPAFLLTFA